MWTVDIIADVDNRAANLDNYNANKNVYEFDSTLWKLLSKLSADNPQEAAEHFSLDSSVVSKLATATPDQLERLASGVILSFKLDTPEPDIINLLRHEYDPALFVTESINDFDSAYWLLINQCAKEDIDVAKDIFGVSRILIEKIRGASDSQLRFTASNIQTYFSLRFDADVVLEIMESDKSKIPLFKKLQQSLTQTCI